MSREMGPNSLLEKVKYHLANPVEVLGLLENLVPQASIFNFTDLGSEVKQNLTKLAR
ncbi:hypothetical protein QIS74_12681 [Colletotrichum tabaci]|uniref:Uncharacterized protein n=1 Tax=Colletotrichum tabaci TaxID=1209068 RepID=A0AAV9SWF1_9PEZI